MKTLKFKLIAYSFLLFGITACINSKDGCDCENEVNDSGEKTFISLSLTFPKNTTSISATSDPNATEAEAKITKIDLFIYAEAGYFLSHSSLNVADFDLVASSEALDKYVYTGTEKIATTTGKRKIFVGINMPDALVNSLLHKGNSELTQVAKNLAIAELTSNTSGFIMTSAIKDCVFMLDEEDAGNNPTIAVQRMTAKITVKKAENIITAGVPGAISDLMFAVNNINKSSYLAQGDAPEYKDPNWASGSYNVADFETSNFVSVNSATAAVGDLNVLYAAENTSEDHLSKELTYLTLRGKFIPKQTVVFQNGTDNTNGYKFENTTITIPETFYVVTVYKPNPEKAFFYSEAIAKDFAADNGLTDADVETFTDGYCYWDMFLNRNNWDVLRNNYYKSTITRIVALGRPVADLPDPNNPPASDTNIECNVDVLDWVLVEEDYELEP